MMRPVEKQIRFAMCLRRPFADRQHRRDRFSLVRTRPAYQLYGVLMINTVCVLPLSREKIRQQKEREAALHEQRYQQQQQRPQPPPHQQPYQHQQQRPQPQRPQRPQPGGVSMRITRVALEFNRMPFATLRATRRNTMTTRHRLVKVRVRRNSAVVLLVSSRIFWVSFFLLADAYLLHTLKTSHTTTCVSVERYSRRR